MQAVVSTQDNALVINNLAGIVMRRIPFDGVEVSSIGPVWSNDGTKIAVQAKDPASCKSFLVNPNPGDSAGCRLYIVDLTTGEAEPIAEDARAAEHALSVAWSSDDSYVYYVRGTVCSYGCTSGTLYRVRPDGTGEKQIADIRVDVIYGFAP